MEGIARLIVPEDMKAPIKKPRGFGRLRKYAIAGGITLAVSSMFLPTLKDYLQDRQPPQEIVFPEKKIKVSIARTKNSQKRLLEDFVKELSKYDILHFGEMHYREASDLNETSTAEDFAELFLSNLRNPNLTNGKPYDFIRLEHLSSERGLNNDGLLISQEELDVFDKEGISKEKTPTFFSMMYHLQCPERKLHLFRNIKEKGFKIRGLLPRLLPKYQELTNIQAGLADNPFSSLEPEIDNWRDNEINRIALLRWELITQVYLTTIRHDLDEGKKRMIIYGGASHNDDSDIYGFGIADEIKKEYPGRYVSIDLVKPSLKQGEVVSYFVPESEVIRGMGFNLKNLESLILMKKENDKKAEYVLFLPSRRINSPE